MIELPSLSCLIEQFTNKTFIEIFELLCAVDGRHIGGSSLGCSKCGC